MQEVQSPSTIIQPAERVCPRCGAALGGRGPEGLCLACLLRAGLDPVEAEPAAASSGLMSLPRRFGDYELLEEVARGGMGVVYRARQVSLNRTVAVKMVLAGQFASAADLARFRAEAGMAARLQHPNIVAIHEVGEREGQPYFSMDLVEGPNLAQLSGNAPLPARRAAQYLKTIAEAVEYAHGKGVLHRDLKPSNVLVDAATDTPRVTDFGLAKRLDDARLSTLTAQLTQTGQVLGSPNFMSPEQAAGKQPAVGAASDVYSLGAILYQMLTGRPPFVAESVPATLRMVMETEPVAPRLLNAGVPRDLETSCLKCLHKDSTRRYLSAQELAEDLDRFLRDEPIRARPVSSAEKFTRWCRRHPALASLSLLVLVLVTGIALVSSVAAARLKRANQEGLEKQRQALLAQARATRFSQLPGRRFDGLAAIRDAARIRPGMDLRNEAVALMALVDLHTVNGADLPLQLYAGVSSKYQRYAVKTLSNSIAVHELPDHRIVSDFIPRRRPPQPACFSSDERWLALWSDDGPGLRITVCETATGHEVLDFATTGAMAADFSSDNRLFAAGKVSPRGRPSLAVHATDDWRLLTEVAMPGQPQSVRFSPDGNQIAWVSRFNAVVSILTLGQSNLTQTLTHGSNVHSAEWSREGRQVVTTCADWRIYDWDLERQPPMAKTILPPAQTIAAHFNPVGNLIAGTSWDNQLRLWDAATGEELFRRPSLGYAAFPFSADGTMLASYASEARLEFCTVADGREWRTLPPHVPGVTTHPTFSFSPDGRWLLVSGTEVRFVQVLDSLRAKEVIRFGDAAIWQAEFGPSGERILTLGADGLLAWPVKVEHRQGDTHLDIGSPVTLSSGSSSAVFYQVRGGQDLHLLVQSNLLVVDATTGMERARHQLPGEPYAKAFSPNGEWAALWRLNGAAVDIVKLDGSNRFRALPVPAASGLAFSPDGRTLIAGSGNEYVGWEVATWQAKYRLLRPASGGMHAKIAFSPDGRLAAVSYSASSVRLLDTGTGAELCTFEPPEPAPISHLQFAPDGGRLLVSFASRAARILDLRLVRAQLAELKLDLEIPPLPASTSPSAAGRVTAVANHPVSERRKALPVPPRDRNATPLQVDLSPHYNALLTSSWTAHDQAPGNDLAALPSGTATLTGAKFDLRGLIQLDARVDTMRRGFPREVTGVAIQARCRALNFLQATAWTEAENVRVGEYVVHYVGGSHEVVPLLYGRNTAGWWTRAGMLPTYAPGTTVAWQGQNPGAAAGGYELQLGRFRWVNPRPDVEIQSVDFRSAMAEAAPFLVALTIEP